MDPLLDEKLVLTISRDCAEFIRQNLYLYAEKEAYGPSRNEGLCYESCSRVDFMGEVEGSLFFCMDGYTKLKLMPRIADRFQIDPSLKGMAESVLLEFANQLTSTVVIELQEGGFDIQMGPPENLSHKIVPIDLSVNRQYIIIFFLRDRRMKEYLGRIYIVLLVRKFKDSRSADSGEAGQGTESPPEAVSD